MVACVLFGHCEEDLATPYQLFAEALGHLVDHAPDDVLASLVGGDGAVLAGLLPGLVRRLPGIGASTATDADTGRYQLFAAVVELVGPPVGAASRWCWCWRTCSGRTGPVCSCCVTSSGRTARCAWW